jgi:hypothetical protein
MRVGFIGAGNVTRTFGRHLINAGHIQFERTGDLDWTGRRTGPRRNGWYEDAGG